MSTHSNKVNGLTAKELSHKFSATTYDYQGKFFEELQKVYKQESKADEDRGYNKLSNALHAITYHIPALVSIFNYIWKICEPHTEIKEVNIGEYVAYKSFTDKTIIATGSTLIKAYNNATEAGYLEPVVWYVPLKGIKRI